MKPESKFRSGVIAAVTVNMLCATPVLAEETSTGHIDDSRLLTGQGTFVTSTQFDAMEMPRLAAAGSGGAEESKSAESNEQASPECAKSARDPNADVGDVIRAGCKPTLAQMSTLMNNPEGNVAMWWNQIDYYGLNNPRTNESDHKTNYMGIVQWPQALTRRWNLINRVVYNVTRSPVDQDKVDDFGSTQGALMPPSSFGKRDPIDVFGGSTTGLGDSYYVGLFSPKEPVKMGAGNFVWGLGFDAGFPTATGSPCPWVWG